MLEDRRLRVTATSNAPTPFITTQVPMLTIDVWEHAYLDYQHRRLDYIAAFRGHLINFDFANEVLARKLAAVRSMSPSPTRAEISSLTCGWMTRG